MKSTLASVFRKYWQLYLFLILPVAYVIIFSYIPMVGIQLAFKDFNYKLGIWGSPWIGFEKFIEFFKSYMFGRVMKNTIRISLYSAVAGFPVPVIFALALNCVYHTSLKKTVQTITYMPHFISTVVLVGIMKQIFHPRVGIYGIIFKAITGTMAGDLFTSPAAFDNLYVWSGVWQGFGWGSILYLASLAGVAPELHEAAEIDGANRLQRIFYVDFPAILPTVTITLIMRVGSILGVGFEKIYLMQNDMNLRMSEVISTYVYKRGLGSGGNSDYSFATAVGLFNNVINLILLAGVNKLASVLGETSLW